MKKKIIAIVIAIIAINGLMIVPNSYARPACHPDPETGEEVCLPERPADDDDDDEGEGETRSEDDPCNLAMGSKPPGMCDEEHTEDTLVETISRVLDTVYLWVGIIAVVFIIIGGINYTMSQGDPGKVKKAKDTILYAVIGLIVSLLAFAITAFVLNALEGRV